MLNKEERFSSCGQANASGFLPYLPEFKKDFICFRNKNRRRILEAFKDKARGEGARVRHSGRLSLPLVNKDL